MLYQDVYTARSLVLEFPVKALLKEGEAKEPCLERNQHLIHVNCAPFLLVLAKEEVLP